MHAPIVPEKRQFFKLRKRHDEKNIYTPVSDAEALFDEDEKSFQHSTTISKVSDITLD